jgi:TolB-like protein/DNA-binding winged helix-turn-helix (wHTH) protein/Tfp pilus assembly protein PilF
VRYRFAEHTLDDDLYELRRGDECLEIQPKVLDVLRYLLEHADRAVPKQELLETLWPGVMVGDAVLTRAISQARRALGEQHRDDGIIRTVRGRGYRIGVPVEREVTPRPSDASEEARDPDAEVASVGPRIDRPPSAGVASPEPARDAAPARGRRLAWLSVPVVALLLFAMWMATAPEPPAPAPAPPEPPVRAAPRTAIAVLPFEYMGGDGREYLADGFTEEIITALSKLPHLQVAARTSSFAFKGRHEDIRTIGRQLGVSTVLEGSVRVENQQLRVTAQLIEASGGFHLWSEVYDRATQDIFAVQDEIAAAIATRLTGTLTDEAALPSSRRATNFEAYQLYLRGRASWGLKTQSGLVEARGFFERALELDPNYASAHAGLSDVYRNTWSYVRTEPRDGPLLARAEDEARRALALDPANAEALISLASAVQDRHRDWAQAESLFRRALELNGGSAVGHLSYGTFLLIRGRADEARTHLERALELDPLSPMMNTQFGRVALYTGDRDAAIAALRRALELNPRDPAAPRLLYLAYEAQGRPVDARDAYLRVVPPPARPPVRAVARIFGNAAALRCIATLARVYPALSPDGPWGLALALAYLGDEEAMYDSLERAEAKDLSHVRLDPVFEPYRQTPRFQRLMQEAGYGD